MHAHAPACCHMQRLGGCSRPPTHMAQARTSGIWMRITSPSPRTWGKATHGGLGQAGAGTASSALKGWEMRGRQGPQQLPAQCSLSRTPALADAAQHSVQRPHAHSAFEPKTNYPASKGAWVRPGCARARPFSPHPLGTAKSGSNASTNP